ncbi:MAG: pilin [Candidatus Berkelbacteria bacterium]
MIEKTHAAIGSLSQILGNNWQNPQGQSFDSITFLITGAVTLLNEIAGIIAFLMIIYGGILYLTAYGQEAKLETAKKTLIWSIVGFILIIFAAYVIKQVEYQLKVNV